VPLGLLEIVLLAVVALVFGVRRLRRATAPSHPRTEPAGAFAWASRTLGAATGLAVLVLLVHAGRAFAVRPLKEWDGWAIWATKARALYEFGGAYKPVFAHYEPVAHPILLPSLEAIAFRTMGTYDGTLLHVQLIALAFGFAAALWSLLGDRVPVGILGVAALALLSASPVLAQLSTNLADVPLAFFSALGLVCLARFVDTGDGWTLAGAALFLGAAMLTKSEGLLFATAAFAAVATVTATSRDRRRLAHVGLSAAAAIAILVPWRIYLAANDLRNAEYRLSDALDPGYLADRSERVRPAVSRLWDELSAAEWGLLVPLAAISIVAALLARRYRLAAFAAVWPVLAFLGLVLVYWISVVPIELTLTWTASRLVVSLVIGAAAVAPLLVAAAWREAVPSGDRRASQEAR
jgi:hypothetical protein